MKKLHIKKAQLSAGQILQLLRILIVDILYCYVYDTHTYYLHMKLVNIF